ncbi:MAG TPA: glycosyltransferase 87 family protein [Acidobacteriaceae bacterium]|nr:glycosyltransferase 87 family protein [Acidobacteriaceae bacterium]
MTISSICKLPSSRPVREFKIHDDDKGCGLGPIDVLTAVVSAGGLTASTLYQAHMRTSSFAASDFKTLYASAWCFARGLDAYSIANLKQVFNHNGVVQPAVWYGHAPVYPWTTLALLAPLTALPMIPATYVAILVTGALLACAVAALMYYSAKYFKLELVWRIIIAVLCVSGPLLGFAMNMGNVSAAVCALCVLAFAMREKVSKRSRVRRWMPGIALAIAVLLKPHLAVWCAFGMLLLPERAARVVVIRAAALSGVFAVLTAAALAAFSKLGLQTLSYVSMLAAENAAGASMSAASREPLPVVSQVVSLQSILGFWIGSPVARDALACLLLLVTGLLMARWTRRVDSPQGALLAVGAWCSLGMLATYHRAHDGSLLILLLPWIVARVRRTPLAWQAWGTLAPYCAMSISVDFPTVVSWLSALPSDSAFSFVLLRQAGLAELLLLMILLFSVRQELPEHRVAVLEPAYKEEIRHAA